MHGLFWTASSGWVGTLLIALSVPLPFVLRRHAPTPARAERAARPRSYLQRLWPHYGLGYLILALSLAHTWLPMSAGLAGRTNQAGLYAATAALLLIVWQVLLGRRLRDPATPARPTLRRTHRWIMGGIVTLGIAHLALNGPMISTALRISLQALVPTR